MKSQLELDHLSNFGLFVPFSPRPGKQCMGLVDLDRSWGAETRGYSVRVMTMEPESCSPKNNLLVGRPPAPSELLNPTAIHPAAHVQ